MRGELKWIEIDLGAVASNLRWTLSRLPRGASLMAVVKADAYGHGAERIAAEAVRQGASSLGVLTVDEARRLRAAGVRARFTSGPILPDQAAEAVRRADPTVDPRPGPRLERRRARSGLSIEVDVDSGLGRWLGARDLRSFWPPAPPSAVEADGAFHPSTTSRKNAVEAETKCKPSESWPPPPAVLSEPRPPRRQQFHSPGFDWCLTASGWATSLWSQSGGLRPAPLKNPGNSWPGSFPPPSLQGRAIGYASEYIAPRRMTVATLPVGYSDGLTMEPAERLIGFGGGFQYWGILRGKKVPFVGRCGISHVMVDVTGVPGARVGEAVALPIRRTAAGRNLPRHYGR